LEVTMTTAELRRLLTVTAGWREEDDVTRACAIELEDVLRQMVDDMVREHERQGHHLVALMVRRSFEDCLPGNRR
jgi:hypothetical protein